MSGFVLQDRGDLPAPNLGRITDPESEPAERRRHGFDGFAQLPTINQRVGNESR
jgi:hypothetical protein